MPWAGAQIIPPGSNPTFLESVIANKRDYIVVAGPVPACRIVAIDRVPLSVEVLVERQRVLHVAGERIERREATGRRVHEAPSDRMNSPFVASHQNPPACNNTRTSTPASNAAARRAASGGRPSLRVMFWSNSFRKPS